MISPGDEVEFVDTTNEPRCSGTTRRMFDVEIGRHVFGMLSNIRVKEPGIPLSHIGLIN